MDSYNASDLVKYIALFFVQLIAILEASIFKTRDRQENTVYNYMSL